MVLPPEVALEVPRLRGRPWTPDEVLALSSRTLAYIGDSAFELSVRLRLLGSVTLPGGHLTGTAVTFVNARHQAMLFEQLLAEAPADEREMLVHWRNAKQPTGRTRGGRAEYARSTAFEAWVGYLFLTGQTDRLATLIDRALAPGGDGGTACR